MKKLPSAKLKLFFLIVMLCLFASPVLGFVVQIDSKVEETIGVPVRIILYRIENIPVSKERRILADDNARVGERIDLSEEYIPDGPLEIRVETDEYKYIRPVTELETRRREITVEIYPAGASRDDLALLKREILIRPSQERIILQEKILIENNTKKIYAAKRGRFTFNLPLAGEEFFLGPGFTAGNDIEIDNKAVKYNLSFPPGKTELGFYYHAPGSGSGGSLNWLATRSIGEITVVLPAYEGLAVEAAAPLLRREVESANTMLFEARQISANTEFNLSWEGLHEKDIAPATRRPPVRDRGAEYWIYRFVFWAAAVMLTFGVVLLAIVIWWMLRKNSQLSFDQEFLDEELKELERAFEKDEIGEHYYKNARKRWREISGEL